VRKSVRAIGRCAIKIDAASEKCVNVLLDLIKGKAGVNHIVQEAIIVIKVCLISNNRIFSASIP
jgi:AP-1 complex subunit beta-1